MMARLSATPTGPRNGIERRIFQPGCRRACVIVAAFAFGRSSCSTSSFGEQRLGPHAGAALLETRQPFFARGLPIARCAGRLDAPRPGTAL
jgi:hypothetical protein